MRIKFFEGESGLDQRAIFGGIYQVELGRVGVEDRILLYIGESRCILRRGNEHLSEFLAQPEYFGMTQKQLKREDLIMRFSLAEEEIKENRGFSWQKRNALLRRRERELVGERLPLTQEGTNDHQLTTKEKLERVHKAIKEKLDCDK